MSYGYQAVPGLPQGDYQQDWERRHPYWRPWWPKPYDIQFGPRRNAPAEEPFKEHNPYLGGWWQGGRKLHGFQPKHYFTRPCDGKSTGAAGRLKDALTGEGPDVFITTSGDRRTLMRDRPQRHQWAGWELSPSEIADRRAFDPDWRLQDEMPIVNSTWTNERLWRPHYNYRNREFESGRKVNRKIYRDPTSVWTNVDWGQRAKGKHGMPLSFKDANPWGHTWHTRVDPWAGMWAGGRPRF